MPRTRSLAWAELKIGLISTFAIVMTVLMIFLLSGEGGFSWQQYGLKTRFDNVAGLKPGAPVRVAGVEVGSVTDTTFAGDRVEVAMRVNEKYRHLVTSESTASLGSVSLLGEAAVDITAGSGGTVIPEWGYVKSGRAVGSLTDVAEHATQGIEHLTAVLDDLRNGRGTVGQLLTNDSLYRELNSLVAAAEEVAQNVNSGRGTIGRLANNPAAAQALETTLQNLQEVTARIRAGEGSLGKFLNDDALHRNLTSMSSNVDTITGRLSKGEGTAGALLNERELYDRMNSMMNRLDQVTAALQKGEGTAGQLLHDKQLYENMNASVAELRKLIAAISADPKKYLNVKVSIF
jgi:phospholipid/cholesterol/gamma-HCH transport system substrate-binding protein